MQSWRLWDQTFPRPRTWLLHAIPGAEGSAAGILILKSSASLISSTFQMGLLATLLGQGWLGQSPQGAGTENTPGSVRPVGQ